jgi:hypothetical protein
MTAARSAEARSKLGARNQVLKISICLSSK